MNTRNVLSGAALLAILGVAPGSVLAHRCGPSEITIRAGECVSWEITADVMESEPTDYGLPSPPGANASTRPGDPTLAGFPFAKKNLGVYRICGVVPGTTSMTAAWAYAPNMASGNCPLSITVVAESSAPSSSGDESDSGEDGDPVNTFSGELYQLYAPDLRLDGPMPLEFRRYYSSGLTRFDGRRGRLGDGWRSNYGMGLSGDSNRIDIDFRYGQRIRFDKVGSDWLLTSPTDGRFQLVENAGDFVLMDPSDQHRYRFFADGRLKAITDRNGNALTMGYAGSGDAQVPDSVSDGLGRQLDLTINSFQFYSQVSDGMRSANFFTSVNFGADEASQLQTATDPDGAVSAYAYLDPVSFTSGLMTQVTRDEGNVPLVTAWDASDRVDSQTDAGGGVWDFSYAAPDTTVTDPDGDQVVHTHDAAGRLVGLTNPDLDVQTIAYDGNGRRSSVTDAIGRTTGMSYDPASGQLASVTDAGGDTTSYVYQSTSSGGFDYFDLASISFDDGRTWQFGRNANGNLSSYVEPGGATWMMTVNARGQVLTVQNPLGGTETRSYRADGMLQTRTDASGNTDTYAYDAVWRVQAITHEDGSTRSFTRDGMDRLTGMTDELGRTTSLQYDGNGRLAQLVDTAGNVRSYGYDNADRLTSVTDALSQTRTITHDLLGRKTSETLANGESVSYTYSALGFPATTTRPWGGVWTYTYDAVGQLTAVANPESETTRFDHDAWGRVTAIHWPAGGTAALVYDEMGRLQRQTDAAGRQTDYRHDAAGRLAGIDAGSVSIDTRHNALALLTGVTDPAGGSWSWTYDNAGRLVSSSDPGGDTTTYTHDNRNRYAVITFADGDTDTQTYDARGHLTRRRGFDGSITDIDFSYDTLGRLSGGSGLSLGYDAEGRMTSSNGLTINRQAATGRVSSVVYPSGPTVTYRYTAGGLLEQIDDGLGGVTSISHDAVGRITGISRPNGVSSTWTWDDNGRIQRVQHGTFVDVQLTRDASGFINSAVREQPTHYSVATAVESQTVNASLEVSGATHDARGAVTAVGAVSFSRDPFARASSRDGQALSWDALGHLTSHAAGGSNIGLLWNYGFAQPVVGTSTQLGTPLWHYVSLPDGRLLYRTNGTQRQYYHCDEMGNVLAITDDAGSVIASYGYSPYGRRSESGIAGGISDNPFTWGGEHFVISDSVQRLYVMGSRFYDSQSMRFLSRDRMGPWLNPLAFNPYGYAAGNPLYFNDPWGDNPPPAAGSQGPTVLDVVTEVVNVVGAGGTTQGILEESANAGLKSARETTVPLARQLAQGGSSASSARGAFNQAASAQRSAQGALTQTTSRGMKALGNLGNAATFLGGLIEAYKLNGKLNQHESDYSRGVRKALASSERMSENAFQSYKDGSITAEQLRERLDRIKELLDDQLENEDDLYDLDVAYDAADSVFGFMMGLAPGGDKLYAGLKWGLGVP